MEFEPNKGAECSGFWPVTKDSPYDVTHLERGAQPSDSELFGTPVVDNWELRAIRADDGSKHFVVRGFVSSDQRWTPGTLITTSHVIAIDGRRAWTRTKNSVYRLGRPYSEIPLMVEIACQPKWEQAWENACASMGRHTVSEFIWKTATTLEAGSVDWGRRRVRAAMVHEELKRVGRSVVADAWALLSVTDATDTKAVGAIYDRMCQVAGSFQTPLASDCIDGWGMMARGETLNVDLSDPVAAAHRLGQPGEIMRAPLIVRMASAPDAITAARIFLSSARIPAALCEVWKVDALIDPATRRTAAQSMLEAYGDGTPDDLYWGLVMLSIRADDVQGVAVIRSALRSGFEGMGRDPDKERLYRAWQMLALAPLLPLDPEDPIESAWHLDMFSGTDALRELKVDIAADTQLKASGVESDEVHSGVIVLAAVGGTIETTSGKEAKREFKDIAGCRLPRAVADDIVGARAMLRDEFPHLHTQVDVMLCDVKEGEPIRFRPTLLVGNPGGGKSRLARRMAEILKVGLHRYDGSGSSDNAFGGTPRRWSSGEHCTPLEAIRRTKIANPVLLIDEIDKAARGGNNGSLANALIPMLEIETARAHPDPYVQSECDLSFVNFILTANDDTVLPGPLRDRLRVVRLPLPTLDHMVQLARGIVADLAREAGGDNRWFPDLDDGELAVVEGLWPGGSVRRLRTIIERILAHRELNPRN